MLLASLQNFLACDEDGKFSHVWLKCHSVEFTHLSVDQDLLLRDAACREVLSVKELNAVFQRLFHEELVHARHVVSLWMNVQAKLLGIFGSVHVQDLSRWKVHKRNPWEDILVSGE